MGNQWTALRLADGWTIGEVRWHWSGAYRIFGLGGSYSAVRRDSGAALVARDLDELVSKIRTDYRACPVSR